MNTFKACIVRLDTLAINSRLLPVIRFLWSVHHCFHEIVANISWLKLMYPLKQALTVHRRKYFVYSIPSCNLMSALFGIDLFWWWFTGCIGYKFPYLVVGPKFLLLFLLGQCCPLDRYVNLLMHIESIIEGFVINVEDTFVQCYFLK